MLAVDDGIVNGNLDFADILFLIATVLFVIGAILSFPPSAPPATARSYVWVVGFIALALTTLGWFVL